MRFFVEHVEHPYSEHDINHYSIVTGKQNLTYNSTEFDLNIQLQDGYCITDIEKWSSFFIVLENHTYIINGRVISYNYDLYYKYAELTIGVNSYIVDSEVPPKWILSYYREDVIDQLLKD